MDYITKSYLTFLKDKRVLRFKIFPLVSFCNGILSHLPLRNHNNWYLGETKSFARLRVEGHLAALLLSDGFLLKQQRYLEIWTGGGVWAQLRALYTVGFRVGNRLQLLWGEFSTTAGFCLLLPSSTLSGALLIRAASTLGSY